MRPVVAAALCVLLLTTSLPQEAAADPVAAVIYSLGCMGNWFLVGGRTVGDLADCVHIVLDGTGANMPLCSQAFDRAQGVLETAPCPPLDCSDASQWGVDIVASGSLGSLVTGGLSCGGSPAVTAQAVVGPGGLGTGRNSGSPQAAATPSCGLSGPPPAGVDRYFVLCVPFP